MNTRTKFMTPKTILRLALVLFVFPLIPMIISGVWNWWEAWVYVIISALGFIVSRALAARRHPDILDERSRSMELQGAKSCNLGWTAVIESIILGDGGPRHTETLKALVEAGANVNLPDRQGQTPLFLARSRGYHAMVSILKGTRSLSGGAFGATVGE